MVTGLTVNWKIQISKRLLNLLNQVVHRNSFLIKEFEVPQFRKTVARPLNRKVIRNSKKVQIQKEDYLSEGKASSSSEGKSNDTDIQHSQNTVESQSTNEAPLFGSLDEFLSGNRIQAQSDSTPHGNSPPSSTF